MINLNITNTWPSRLLFLGVCLLLAPACAPQTTTTTTSSGLMQQNQRHATIIALDPWNRSVQCVETTDDSRGNSIESLYYYYYLSKNEAHLRCLRSSLFGIVLQWWVVVVVVVMLCLMVSYEYNAVLVIRYAHCLKSIFTLNTQPLFQ